MSELTLLEDINPRVKLNASINQYEPSLDTECDKLNLSRRINYFLQASVDFSARRWHGTSV